MHLSQHVHENRLVIAIIDSDLANTEWAEGNKVLNFKSPFYSGEEASEDQIRKMIKKAHAIHAAGKNTMEFLERENYHVNAGIHKISGIPFVQILQE